MAVNLEDLTAGAMIRVPGYGGHTTQAHRPYCLLLTRPAEVSKVTGAVTLSGEVRAVDGTTTRRKKLFRTTVRFVKDLELATPADA